VADRPGPEGEAAELELELLEDPDAQYIKVRAAQNFNACFTLSQYP
jgi:hypothetical protein